LTQRSVAHRIQESESDVRRRAQMVVGGSSCESRKLHYFHALKKVAKQREDQLSAGFFVI
jgi:hypothetical protein